MTIEEEVKRFVAAWGLLEGLPWDGDLRARTNAVAVVLRHDSDNSKGVKKSNEPASVKQLDYMTKLGVEFEAGISKAEASALIEKAVREKHGKDK